MIEKKKYVFFLMLACASLVACSRGTDSAETTDVARSHEKEKQPKILIERELQWADPQAYLQKMRNTLETCQYGKSEVAKAAGVSYDPKTEAISDEEIMALESEHIIEAFDGENYARITTTSNFDSEKYGPTEGDNCKPVAKRTKSVEIWKGECNAVSVVYDLNTVSGSKQEISFQDCKKSLNTHLPSERTYTQEHLIVPGNGAKCRWSVQGPKGVSTCDLEPWFKYPGSDRDLLVSSRVNLDAQTSQDERASSKVWNAVRVEVEQALPQGIFDVPEDAKNFPPPSEGHVGN